MGFKGTVIWLVVIASSTAVPAQAAGVEAGCRNRDAGMDRTQIEASAPEMVVCDAGGFGASACEARTTINVGGWGATEGCGVTCADGYYACCQNASLGQTAVCSCVQVPRRRSSFEVPEW